MFLAEFLYSFDKLVHLGDIFPYKNIRIDEVTTIFGKFKVRSGTMDVICVSPAFERPDVNFLLKILKKEGENKKKILFLDIGADIGTYAVTVANKFSTVDIIAFEPSHLNRQLLVQNIALNNATNHVEVIPKALGSQAGQLTLNIYEDNPGSNSAHANPDQAAANTETVDVITLDSLIASKVRQYDLVVFKMDVEGMEEDVLRGATQVLASNVRCILMVEDFVDTKIITYLEKIGAQFITKKTTYNSFWEVPTK